MKENELVTQARIKISHPVVAHQVTHPGHSDHRNMQAHLLRSSSWGVQMCVPQILCLKPSDPPVSHTSMHLKAAGVLFFKAELGSNLRGWLSSPGSPAYN